MIKQRVIAVLATETGLSLGKIDLTSSLSQLGLDSLEQANLALVLEDEFNTSIPRDVTFTTVQDILTYLEGTCLPHQQ